MSKIRMVLLIGFFHQAVIQGTRPLIPLLANELGADKIEIGVIAAVFAIFPFLFAVKAGSWIDKWGVKNPIIIGSIGVIIAVTLPFFFTSIPFLYLSQIIAGISQIFVNLSLQNFVGLHSSADERDRNFGWFNFSTSAGQFAGPVSVGFFADETSLAMAFFITSCIAIIPVLAGFTIKNSRNFSSRHKAKINPKDSKKSSLELLLTKGMHQALLMSILAVFTREVVTTYFPLFAVQQGISAKGIGFVLGTFGLSATLIRLFQGVLLRHIKRKIILLVSLGLGGMAFGMIPFFSHIAALSMVTIFIGMGTGLVKPLSMVAVANLSPLGHSGQAFGLRIAGNRLSQALSPLLFGFIAQWTGIIYVFWMCGGILLLGAVYASKDNEKSTDQNR